MSSPTPLWRADLAQVSPMELRPACYALRLVLGIPWLRQRLHDRDLLAPLWNLIQPLLAPGRRKAIAARPGVDEEPTLDALRLDSDLTQRVFRFFKGLDASALPALEAAEHQAERAAPVAMLESCLGLTAGEVRVLDYLDQCECSPDLRGLLRECTQAGTRINRSRLATLLGLSERETAAALSPRAPLRTCGLASYCDSDQSDLEDFLRPTSLLREVLNAGPVDVDALLDLLIEAAPPAAWHLEAFPHLATDAAHLRESLQQAVTQGTVGVNALLYGPPGTGKTEFARALAAASGLQAYQVRSDDADGDGLRREGRLSAYLLAQRLLSRRQDALLIFDEIEDVFASPGDGLLSLLRGSTPVGQQKGWMNRILEENPVPAVWISNATSGMDPAFLRRFLLPVACRTPPRSVRREMAERHLGDCGLPPELLDELAADAALTPAQLGAARRLLELRPEAAGDQTVRHGVAALRTLLQGSPAPVRRHNATRFDLAFLNLAGDIAPGTLVQALHRRGQASLCFYGPPGTGKTAFAEVLAEVLDRELITHRASDLLSPYVGETEHNLARMFRDCDPTQGVLFLDEVDSFLADRRDARHLWERTQVNELLQQMERFPGIFIAATNLMDGIDTAALRRFDFKLLFRPLTRAQRWALFAREALGDAQAPLKPEWARYLEGLQGLTPGDFATVCRQRNLLGQTLSPEQFLRGLAGECRMSAVEVHGA